MPMEQEHLSVQHLPATMQVASQHLGRSTVSSNLSPPFLPLSTLKTGSPEGAQSNFSPNSVSSLFNPNATHLYPLHRLAGPGQVMVPARD